MFLSFSSRSFLKSNTKIVNLKWDQKNNLRQYTSPSRNLVNAPHFQLSPFNFSSSRTTTTTPFPKSLISPQIFFSNVKSLPDSRTEKFWEIWNEEIKAIRQGKEYVPNEPSPQVSKVSPFWRFIVSLSLFFLLYKTYMEFQIDRKTILKMVNMKVTEAAQRSSPLIKLALDTDSHASFKAETKKYTIVSENRFCVFLFRYYDNHHIEFRFSPFERCFGVQCDLTITPKFNTKGNEEQKEPEVHPFTCHIHVSRMGGILRLDLISLEFPGNFKKFRIPTETAPTREWSFYALSIPWKI